MLHTLEKSISRVQLSMRYINVINNNNSNDKNNDNSHTVQSDLKEKRR
jgi:hypothetical protein